MTFKDWVKQIHKECDAGVTYKQTMKIMVTALRVMMEEFRYHPDTATLEFSTLGKFFLIKRNYTVPKIRREEGKFIREGILGTDLRWTLKFRQYPNVGRVLNGEMNIRDLKVGGIPLYPDKPLTNNIGRKPIKFTTDQTMDYQIRRVQEKKKKNKKRNVSLMSRLPEDI